MEVYTKWTEIKKKREKNIRLTIVLKYKYFLCFKCQNDDKVGNMDIQFTGNCNTIIRTANSFNLYFVMDY